MVQANEIMNNKKRTPRQSRNIGRRIELAIE
jgi:hypothetical protein